MRDYIEGDLMEVYERNFKTLGKRQADWKFILDVLLLFRPGIIRPRKPYLQKPAKLTPISRTKVTPLGDCFLELE